MTAPPDPKRAGGTNGWAIAAFVVGGHRLRDIHPGKSVQAVDLNTGDCVKDAYERALPRG
jgi:hypothetical protein